MTKVNHNRPSLRYMDNLRRELYRPDLPGPRWFDKKRHEILSRVDPSDPMREHLDRFSTLSEREQYALGSLFEAFEQYQHASINAIELIMTNTTKQKRARKAEQDSAYERVVVSGALLVKEVITSASRKQEGAWHWLRRLYELSDRQMQMAYADIHAILMGESLPLYVAQVVADTPEEVECVRAHLTEDKWA